MGKQALLILFLTLLATGCQTRLASQALPEAAPSSAPTVVVLDFMDNTYSDVARGMDTLLPWSIPGLGAAAADEAAFQLAATGQYGVIRHAHVFTGDVEPFASYDYLLAGYIDTFWLGAGVQTPTWYSPLSLAALAGFPMLYVYEEGRAELQLNLISTAEDRGIATWHLDATYGPMHQMRGLMNMKARRRIAANQLLRKAGDHLMVQLIERLETTEKQ